MSKHFFKRLLKYLLISVVIFAIVTALVLLFAFFTLGYFSPAYVSTVNFAAGLFITCLGAFTVGSSTSITTKLGIARGGLSSAMRDYKTHKLLANAKDSHVKDNAKLIYIGIFVIAFGLLSMLLTGM